ncbi:MAG: glutamate--cysteine ligase [Myxococcota bacterium]|nr:glutamate--cysteine ligase [Myxococcota bacterium]
MGLEIDREEFADADYARFEGRLATSIRVVRGLLARPGFGAGPMTLGAELEASLVDTALRPAPLNHAVLAESVDPRLTFELDRFNLESNLRYDALAGRPFAFLASEMDDALLEMRRAAELHDVDVALIGILPTLTEADLQADAMTDSMRYRALSASLKRLRREPFRLDIHGEDDLQLACHDVTYEGAATSLQLHLRVDPADFASLYNAIQLTTPAVLALSANSPTFLGRRLWDETRVALFKQAVDPRPRDRRNEAEARVSFGKGWVEGPLELFEESVDHHPPLLPILDAEDPEAAGASGVPALRELRLHQGSVWRWNRAIYDPGDGGHLRVEMRALPSGPTVADMVASAAFHVGLALDVARELGGSAPDAPFEEIHHDFYRAAREGPDTRLRFGEASLPVRELGETLLARAQAGLDAAGVERVDSQPPLSRIERRLRRSRTGARWQREALGRAEETQPRGEALVAMFRRYQALCAEGAGVDEWPDPDA